MKYDGIGFGFNFRQPEIKVFLVFFIPMSTYMDVLIHSRIFVYNYRNRVINRILIKEILICFDSDYNIKCLSDFWPEVKRNRKIKVKNDCFPFLMKYRFPVLSMDSWFSKSIIILFSILKYCQIRNSYSKAK